MVLAGRTACGERSELVGTGKGIGSVHSRDESLPGRNQTPPETLEHFVDTPAKLKTHRASESHADTNANVASSREFHLPGWKTWARRLWSGALPKIPGCHSRTPCGIITLAYTYTLIMINP